MILVDVEARSWPGRVLTVLSDDEVDGAEAETLLTTEETIDRSTVHVSAMAVTQTIGDAWMRYTYSSPAVCLISAQSPSFRQNQHSADIAGCVTIGQNAMLRAQNDSGSCRLLDLHLCRSPYP